MSCEFSTAEKWAIMNARTLHPELSASELAERIELNRTRNLGRKLATRSTPELRRVIEQYDSLPTGGSELERAKIELEYAGVYS
jgi:hypothetical protein